MTRKILGIALCGAAVVITAALIVMLFRKNMEAQPEQQSGTELVELLPVQEQPETAQTEETDMTETSTGAEAEQESVFRFLLLESNDAVIVYELPGKELFEYTDVNFEALPEALRNEIQQGKYLKSEEELYNFLENYTS
ncbi:MAG: hypothetical protein LUC98_13990 [Lachnospiraceae bacterium]|nr:hypothetical protein [Lachnospiraceae bacterium]